MVAAMKEKKVKLFWEELKNGGPFRKLFLVGAEYLLIYGVVKEMYEKIVLHEDVAIQLIIFNTLWGVGSRIWNKRIFEMPMPLSAGIKVAECFGIKKS